MKCEGFSKCWIILCIVRLSYKKSAGDQWTRVIEKPEHFQCPEGIADPEDFCYNLSQLSFGVQYTADVSLVH